MLSGFGSGPEWKGLGFGTERASRSRFLPWVEGIRVWDGRCFRDPDLAPGGRFKGLGRNVVSGLGSCPRWKGLGFRTERALMCRFLPRVEGFRVWDGRCSRVSVLALNGRV